jgi:hypothetical protein
MLSELSNVTLVDSLLGRGTKSGYNFQAAYSSSCSEFLWFAIASPQEPGSSGDRYFGTNAAGVIYYTTAAAFPLADCFTLDAHCNCPGVNPSNYELERHFRQGTPVGK